MTLRRSDSLPTQLRVIPVTANDPNIPDSNTNPDLKHTPEREEVIATWKSLNSDVKGIKNGFVSKNAETNGKGTHTFGPAFTCNNRNVQRKITYENRIEEDDKGPSLPMEPGQDAESGRSSARARRSLLQKLFYWKTSECDCRERFTPKYQTPRLRPEDLLCTCGASANRFRLPDRKIEERGRSKSVGYEAAREVAQFRRLVFCNVAFLVKGLFPL